MEWNKMLAIYFPKVPPSKTIHDQLQPLPKSSSRTIIYAFSNKCVPITLIWADINKKSCLIKREYDRWDLGVVPAIIYHCNVVHVGCSDLFLFLFSWQRQGTEHWAT